MKAGSVTFCKGSSPQNPKFSILIPTWNNLTYLQMLIGSIKKNSRYEHDIVIHINDGRDGTTKWVSEQQLSYTHSDENIGVCYAFNSAASLAVSEYLLLIDDDNYVLPDWDYYLLEETEKVGHTSFAISGTKIEPRKTFNPCVLAPFDFGRNPDEFRENELLEAYQKLQFNDWNGSSWYPLV
nr:glycosyltransferase family 2 protein [Bacteroidota bacterium]